MDPQPPEEGTVERWAWELLHAPSLEALLSPPAPPTRWEGAPVARVLAGPSRPAPLRVTAKAPRTPGPNALRDPARRAAVVHTFLHHEVQAAELFAWALLAFAETPEAFRRGLLALTLDELRHAAKYRAHLAALGRSVGDFEVRDWFWQRVPGARTPTAFVATMGLGFEGANLDHTVRFEALFRAAGDEEGALLQRTIREEERGHVRFGLEWFRRFEGGVDFARWSAALAPPLSPLLMRGRPLAREERLQAGFSLDFVEDLERWQSPDAPGS